MNKREFKTVIRQIGKEAFRELTAGNRLDFAESIRKMLDEMKGSQDD